MLGQGGTGNEKVGLFILYIVCTRLYMSFSKTFKNYSRKGRTVSKSKTHEKVRIL